MKKMFLLGAITLWLLAILQILIFKVSNGTIILVGWILWLASVLYKDK